MPAPRRCLKSPAIHGISARRSASSACSTAGIRRLQFHPHVHCVVAAGGLAPDHSRWISARRSFFLPIEVLSRVFRGKFVAGLRSAFQRGAAPVPRQPGATRRAARLRSMAAGPVPPRLGRLRQAALRRPGTCPALSRRLHPSRRHLQPQTRRSRRWQRHLPLARFRARQQETADDSASR